MPAKKSGVISGRRKTTSVSSVVARKVSKVRDVRKVREVSKVALSKPSARGLVADVYSIAGKKEGVVSLSKEIFGTKVNKKLLSQALHVYFVNRSTHAGSAKTRAEVRGGGAKPWRQKGTGRARAGSRRSPLWVGGGKALGPKHRNVQLALPKKMKRAALLSALSTKANAQEIKIIANLEKIEPRTKIIANLLKKLELKGSSLIILSANSKNSDRNVKLAVRNIQNAKISSANNLNAFEMIKNQNIFFSREALADLPDLLGQNKSITKGANA